MPGKPREDEIMLENLVYTVKSLLGLIVTSLIECPEILCPGYLLQLSNMLPR